MAERMGIGGSGFEGDDFQGPRFPFLYPGIVVRNDDPEHRGRVTVVIPGVIEPESAWALPRTGGARRWGANDVPPVGASVWVQFVLGDPSQPVWDYGDHAGEGDAVEAFPEHEAPEVSVWGRGPFRLVVDTRAGQERATLKLVKEVGGAEESIAWIEFNGADNSIQIHADSAVGIDGGAILALDSGGNVQIKGRTVVPNGKAMN